MKITHVKSKPAKTLNIVDAQYVDDYCLQLTFDDGVTRLVDFKPFLRQARNPMTTKYLDVRKFKQFKIDWGNLSWNDREMIFPIIQLYRGKIQFDVTNRIDLSKADVIREKGAFPNLKRSENIIEIPLAPEMIRRLQDRAKEQRIPLSLLVQRYLEEKMGAHGERA